VNTTADIWIPANENTQITEGVKKIETLKDIVFLRYEKGNTAVAMRSEVYDFRAN
jgi:hypothetical protein